MDGFLGVVKELRGGGVLADCDEFLKELVGSVRATGKAGRLTVMLTVKPASKGDERTLLVTDEIKVTQPKVEHGSTVMFATDENALTRRDPRQPELKHLRDVTPMPSKGATQ